MTNKKKSEDVYFISKEEVKHSVKFIESLRPGSQRGAAERELLIKVLRAIAWGTHDTTNKTLASLVAEAVNLWPLKQGCRGNGH